MFFIYKFEFFVTLNILADTIIFKKSKNVQIFKNFFYNILKLKITKKATYILKNLIFDLLQIIFK